MSKPENPNDILNDMMLTSQAKTRIAESEIDDTMKATVKKKLAKKGIKEPRKSSSWLEAITGKEDRVENRALTQENVTSCNSWRRECNWSSEEDYACPHYNTKCAGNGSYPAAQVGRSDHRRGTPKGNAALADVPLFAGVTSNAAATPPAAAAPTPEAPASTAKKTAAERVALGLASAGVCRGWEYKCESSDDEDEAEEMRIIQDVYDKVCTMEARLCVVAARLEEVAAAELQPLDRLEIKVHVQ